MRNFDQLMSRQQSMDSPEPWVEASPRTPVPIHPLRQDGYVSMEDSGAHATGGGVWHASINILCTMVGVGIVALPSALAKTGWTGLIVVLLGGLGSGYTGIQLVRLALADPRTNGRPLASYGDVGAFAGAAWSPRWSSISKWLAVISQLSLSFSVPVLFLVLQGEFAVALLNSFNVQGVLCDVYWIVIAAGVITPLCWLKSFKEVAVVGIFGFAAAMVLAFVIMGLSAFDPEDIDLTPAHTYGGVTFESYMSAYGQIIFAWGGNFVFVRVMDSMKQASRFKTAVGFSYTLTMAVYFAVCIIPYAVFGEVLANGAPNFVTVLGTSWFARIALIGIVVHVFIAIVVIILPLFMFIEERTHFEERLTTRSKVAGVGARILVRTVILWICTFVAVLLENSFEDIQALIGGTSVTLTCFVLPPLYYIQLYWGEMSTSIRVWNVFLILFGVSAGIASSYFALEKMAEDLSSFSLFCGCHCS